MASAAVHYKMGFLLLLIRCLLLIQLLEGISVWSLFCYAVLSVLSNTAIISMGEESAGYFNLSVKLSDAAMISKRSFMQTKYLCVLKLIHI